METSVFFLLVVAGTASSFNSHRIIVAKDGSGQFRSITEAVDSLPMFNYERITIVIKNGVYHEKIRIDQDYITLEGENKDSTIIEYPQLRTDWIAHRDPIGPAVVNIHGDDDILRNLTIKNTQPEIGPHAFAVYDDGTRTIMVDCNILSKGADTVSPWNYKSGMYYMADCSFSGSVDFVCPRGWCLVKNSKFYEEKKGSASIWHAGSFDRNQKLVLENCSFDGVEGFDLGRHHLEAQFYLLNCTFSKTMSDTPIYRVVYSDSAANQSRPFNWGERDYFYNCHKDGGDYPWLADNLKNSEGNPAPEDITPSWTFGGKWDPESAGGPTVVKQEVDDCRVLFTFSEPVTVVGTPILKLKDGTELRYNSGGGTVTLRFDSDKKLMDVDFSDLQIVNNSDIGGTIASVHERKAVFRENPSK
ncbi:MAG TPA: pectinesterase family protein [Candidatus Acidoferrales bacterium]|nr:pectinesterase family protein [Candidatus Acidoferrales bacterium]